MEGGRKAGVSYGVIETLHLANWAFWEKKGLLPQRAWRRLIATLPLLEKFLQ